MLAIESVLFIFISWRINGTSKSFECALILSCLTKYFAEKEVVISNSTDIYFKVYEKGNLFHNMRALLSFKSLISQFAFLETWLEHPRRYFTDTDCPKLGAIYSVRCMQFLFRSGMFTRFQRECILHTTACILFCDIEGPRARGMQTPLWFNCGLHCLHLWPKEMCS